MTCKAHALALGLLLAAASGALASADVLVLQNGARLEGRVVSLDDKMVVVEQASSGGKTLVSFPRDQVKAIELSTPAPVPPQRAGPAPLREGEPVRDEWWLLQAEGAVKGTRHLTLVPHADDHGSRWRIEEHVRLFGAPKLPGVRVERIEDVDDEYRPRHLHYRELGEPAAEEGGLPGYETIRSGPVKDGVWRVVEGGGSAGRRETAVAVPPGTTTPLALRETLARATPRRAQMATFSVLDPARGEAHPVRAGFARLDSRDGDRHEDVMRVEDGPRVFESRWVAGDPPRCVSEDVAGHVAVLSTKAQADASTAAEGKPTPPPPAPDPVPAAGTGAVPAADPKVRAIGKRISVPEAGLDLPVPGASWTVESPPPPTDDSGRRVVAKLWSSLHAADVRVEWEPAAKPRPPADGKPVSEVPAPPGGAATSAPDVEAALLARLKKLSPDVAVISPRNAVTSLPGAWRMTLAGTRNGERVRVLVMVAERGQGRATILATCPESAWADAKEALESVVLGFRWM